MRKTEQTTPRLLAAIVLALVLAGSPVYAMVHVIDGQQAFDFFIMNATVNDGDKIVFTGSGPIVGTLHLQGVQDVLVTAANHLVGLTGYGSVGNGGAATYVPATAPTIDGMNGPAIRIEQCRRITVTAMNLLGNLGIRVLDSEDIRVFGNTLSVVDGGIQINNGLRNVAASNQIGPAPGSTLYHAFGIAIAGGLDNVAFDNHITEGLDTGIMVVQGAQRTALINNHIEDTTPGTAPFGPIYGIWDKGKHSCLVRNTADGDVNPFRIDCQSTLVGNAGNPIGSSLVCNATPLPGSPVENMM